MDTNQENVNAMLKASNDRTKSFVASCINVFNSIRWKTVSFVIPMAPEPSHRPRLSGYRVYVPGAAKNQSFFNKHVLPKLNGLFITTPCKVKADFYIQTPKSFSNAQKILAEMRILRPWGNVGDVDNYAKSVLDSFQPNEKRGHIGIMSNDCLVISSQERKFYSINPRTEVTIEYMDKKNIPDTLKKVLRMKNMDP